MNINLLLPLGVCLAVVLCAQQIRLGNARENIAQLEAQALELARGLERWKLAYEQASQGGLAHQAQARQCLEREAGRLADEQAWEEILAKAEPRALTETEKGGVPDDNTRRMLLRDLDLPL